MLPAASPNAVKFTGVAQLVHQPEGSASSQLPVR